MLSPSCRATSACDWAPFGIPSRRTTRTRSARCELSHRARASAAMRSFARASSGFAPWIRSSQLGLRQASSRPRSASNVTGDAKAPVERRRIRAARAAAARRPAARTAGRSTNDIGEWRPRRPRRWPRCDGCASGDGAHRDAVGVATLLEPDECGVRHEAVVADDALERLAHAAARREGEAEGVERRRRRVPAPPRDRSRGRPSPRPRGARGARSSAPDSAHRDRPAPRSRGRLVRREAQRRDRAPREPWPWRAPSCSVKSDHAARCRVLAREGSGLAVMEVVQSTAASAGGPVRLADAGPDVRDNRARAPEAARKPHKNRHPRTLGENYLAHKEKAQSASVDNGLALEASAEASGQRRKRG